MQVTKNTNVFLDVDRSLEMCPPDYYPEGVVFEKRIRMRRDKINWAAILQYRQNINELGNVSRIKTSFTIGGYNYECRPQVVCEPNIFEDTYEVDGHQGFNRNAAQSDLNWTHTIVDKIKFVDVDDWYGDGPMSAEQVKLEYGYISNHNYSPSADNTKTDIIKGVKTAIDKKLFSRADDDKIKGCINRIAKDKSQKDKDSIFKTFRDKVSPFATMHPLDGYTADKLAKQLGLPYGGTKNENTTKLGYCRAKGSLPSFLVLAAKLSIENNNTTVFCYGFIKSPNPTTLQSSRISYLEEFNNNTELYYKILAQGAGISLDEARFLDNCPYVFGGFLPQDITTLSDGHYKEEGLVDQFGNPFV